MSRTSLVEDEGGIEGSKGLMIGEGSLSKSVVGDWASLKALKGSLRSKVFHLKGLSGQSKKEPITDVLCEA